MNKKDFIKKLINAGGFEQEVAEAVYKVVIETLKRSLLKSDGKVLLPELGKFEVKVRKARVGVNPNTGEKLKIPEKKTVTFKPSNGILNELNGA